MNGINFEELDLITEEILLDEPETLETVPELDITISEDFEDVVEGINIEDLDFFAVAELKGLNEIVLDYIKTFLVHKDTENSLPLYVRFGADIGLLGHLKLDVTDLLKLTHLAEVFLYSKGKKSMKVDADLIFKVG